jgi:homoserine kinase type II
MFIGVYSSLEAGEAAMARMRSRPGYRDFPDGFRVDSYRVDEDYDDPMFFALWDLP